MIQTAGSMFAISLNSNSSKIFRTGWLIQGLFVTNKCCNVHTLLWVNKGAFINDHMNIWDFFINPSSSVTLLCPKPVFVALKDHPPQPSLRDVIYKCSLIEAVWIWIQWGSEYRPFKFKIHLNSESFRKSNFKWYLQNGGHFVQAIWTPNRSLFDLLSTIQIPNMFGIGTSQ